jgi:putative Mn2+ efflux pump MntP
VSKDDRIAFGVIAVICSLCGAQLSRTLSVRMAIEFGALLMAIGGLVWVIMGIIEKREKKKERRKRRKR